MSKMRRILGGALVLLLMTACHTFNNPVEKEVNGRGAGAVTAVVTGIDSGASVLVVDLHWNETNSVGEFTFRKLVALNNLKIQETVTFDGLAQGYGHVEAASFVGNVPWQAPQSGSNIAISDKGSARTTVMLGAPDGDVDLDFDYDFEWSEAGGDEDTQEAESEAESEIAAETEAEDTQWTPTATLDVPYSSTVVTLDGSVDVTYEWQHAVRATIQTGLQTPALVLAQHNAMSLYLGFYIPSMPTSAGQAELDKLQLAFLTDETKPQDAFVLVIARNSASVSCQLVYSLGRTCNDLLPTPIYSVKQVNFVSGNGWMAEATIPFASLGIKTGLAKTFRFAVASYDNSQTTYSPWPPDGTNVLKPTTYGAMLSSGKWAYVDQTPDGDSESEMDGDSESAAPLDGDSDTADTDSENSEATTDGDQDTDVPEGQPGYCTPNAYVCSVSEGIAMARRCDSDGRYYGGYISCDDNNVCTDDTCVPGATGCTHTNNTASCVDNNACTTNEHCVNGSCVFSQISCDDHNVCTNDFANPAVDGCCYHSNNNGVDCDDGLTCTQAGTKTCYGGTCVGTWTAGCCEGHPDMTFIGDLGGYCIDKYEAVIATEGFAVTDGCTAGADGQRYGAATDDYPAGFSDYVTAASQTAKLYACNHAGLAPSRLMTIAQARLACQNAGKALCTSSQWMRACAGSASAAYPYGASYQTTACNGQDLGIGEPVGSGTESACVREAVYDLSGNVEEWSDSGTVCGGSYASDANHLTCSSCVPPTATTAATRGFRCCVVPSVMP